MRTLEPCMFQSGHLAPLHILGDSVSSRSPAAARMVCFVPSPLAAVVKNEKFCRGHSVQRSSEESSSPATRLSEGIIGQGAQGVRTMLVTDKVVGVGIPIKCLFLPTTTTAKSTIMTRDSF